MKKIRTPTGIQFDSEQSVYLVKKNMGHQKTMKPSSNIGSSNIGSRNICKFCGNQHQIGKKFCPALGKICKTCKKSNHFAKMCKMKSNENHGETSQTQKRQSARGKFVWPKKVIMWRKKVVVIQTAFQIEIFSESKPLVQFNLLVKNDMLE